MPSSRHLRPALLLALTLLCPALSRGEDDLTKKRWAAWQLYGENDALAVLSGSDEYYTNCLRFVWILNPDTNPDWTRDFVDWWCRSGPCPSAQADIAYGHALGHNFYTPETISDPLPRPHDRPWAGYLYFSWLLQVTHPTDPDWRLDRPVQNLFDLQVGVVGPAAGVALRATRVVPRRTAVAEQDQRVGHDASMPSQ